MMRTVLPGHGTPTTFTVTEASTVKVRLTSGKLITVPLKPGTTRIEFLGSVLTPAA